MDEILKKLLESELLSEEAYGEVVEDVDDHNDVIDSTEEEVVTDSVDSEGEEDA
jgi:hypothetical protein